MQKIISVFSQMLVPQFPVASRSQSVTGQQQSEAAKQYTGW